MDEQEKSIARLRQSIEDAKRLKKELQQQMAELDNRIEEARKLRAKAAKKRPEK